MLSKSDRTKQYIIETAAHLFNTMGYAGTSMSDIMEATGLAKGGLYGNFGSKEEIAVLAFEYSMQKIMQELSIKIRQEDHAIRKLCAVCDYYKNYTVSSPIRGGCPMINMGAEVDDTNLPLIAKVRESLDLMLQSIIKIIETGKERKQVHPDIQSRAWAEIFIAQIEGGIFMAKIMDDPKILNKILASVKINLSKELAL